MSDIGRAKLHQVMGGKNRFVKVAVRFLGAGTAGTFQFADSCEAPQEFLWAIQNGIQDCKSFLNKEGCFDLLDLQWSSLDTEEADARCVAALATWRALGATGPEPTIELSSSGKPVLVWPDGTKVVKALTIEERLATSETKLANLAKWLDNRSKLGCGKCEAQNEHDRCDSDPSQEDFEEMAKILKGAE